MQTEKVGMRKHQDGVGTINPIRPATRMRVLVGAIVAAGLVTAAVANIGAARPDDAVGAATDAAETAMPPATVERSGSLAAHPLVY